MAKQLTILIVFQGCAKNVTNHSLPIELMAKLSSLKPRLSTLPPRFGYTTGDEKARNRLRSNAQPWRAWYKTGRWQALRNEVFKRDRYICQRSGQMCIGKGNAPDAPVANHKTPHHGDERLFWDMNNIETVTKAVHDSLVQSEEKRGTIIGSDIAGRPIDPNHPWNR